MRTSIFFESLSPLFTAIIFAYLSAASESLDSLAILSAAVSFAPSAKLPLITPSATSGRVFGTIAASISSISTFFGFDTISFLVASRPTPSLSLIIPWDSRRSNALASFVVSLGTAILSPLVSSSKDFFLPLYTPSASKCSSPATSISVLFFAL